MTLTQINQLRADRMKVVNQARALNDKVIAEKRDFTADEQKQYDDFKKDIAARKVVIDREEEIAGFEEEGRSTRNSPQRPNVNPEHRSEDEDGETAEEIAAREAAEMAEVRKQHAEVLRFSDHRGAHFRALEKTARGKINYRKAYDAFLRSGGKITAGLTAADNRERRTMQADSDTGGGYMLAPATMVADLIKTLDNAVIVRQHAKKFSTGYNGLGAVSLDTDLSDFDWTTELAIGNEDEIAVGKRELKPHPLAKLIKVSKTLARNAPDAVALVQDRLSYVLGVTQEKAYLTGSGAQQPLGVFTASSDGVPTSRDVSTGNTTTAIVADNLKTVKYTLKSQHRAKARWLFHRDAVAMIDKLKDGNGQYLWQPGLVAGQPDRLLNLPLDESEYVPNTFTTGLYVGLLANWDYYWVLDSLDLAVQVLVELYAASNKNGYHARYEGDGMPVLPEAFVRVKLA